jgi:hypothetical protein
MATHAIDAVARALAMGAPRRRVLRLALAGLGGGVAALLLGRRGGLGPEPAMADCSSQMVLCCNPNNGQCVTLYPDATTCWHWLGFCCGPCPGSGPETWDSVCNATFPGFCNGQCCSQSSSNFGCSSCPLDLAHPSGRAPELSPACQELREQASAAHESGDEATAQELLDRLLSECG